MDRTSSFTMTRQAMWALSAISVIVFILLCWIFAEGLLGPALQTSEEWISSPLITYLLVVIILLAGGLQVRGMPAAGIPLHMEMMRMTPGQVEDPIVWQLLLGNIYFALFWMPMRFFLGRDWFSHGAEKIVDPAWMNGGEALKGFWEQAVVIPETGRPPIAYDWFRQFVQYMLDHTWYTWFAKLVVWGEMLVRVALLLGGLVGLAAFFGIFMNFNYLLAGSASTNPVLFLLGIFLVLAWKVAGHWGFDRWLLSALGTRWARAEAQVDAVSAIAAREGDG